MRLIDKYVRHPGDPRVVHKASSALGASDQLGRALGWFSIGLGLTELLAPRAVTRFLGMEGAEPIVRAFGVREIGSGIVSLSPERRAGLWSRVGGDILDIATLSLAYRPENPKRNNVGLALALVAGVTALDLAGAFGTGARHAEGRGERRSYRDRTGFPKGLQAARGLAGEARKAFSGKPAQIPPAARAAGEAARPH